MTEKTKKESRRRRKRSAAFEPLRKQPRSMEDGSAAQTSGATFLLITDEDSDSQNCFETKSRKHRNLCEAPAKTTKCAQNLLDQIRSPINYLSELLTGVFKKTSALATTASNVVDEESSSDQSQETAKMVPVSRSARPSRLSVTVISISDDEDTALTCDACESDSAWPSERSRRNRSRDRSAPPQDCEFHFPKPILERLDTLRSALRCTVMHAANKAGRTVGGHRTSSKANEILSDWRVRRTLQRIEKELRALVRIEPQRTVLRSNAFSLTASDLNTIAGSDTNWLNDAVINAYLSLVASPCSTESLRSTVQPATMLVNEEGDRKRIDLTTSLRSVDFKANSTGRSPKNGRFSLSPSVPLQSATMRVLNPTTSQSVPRTNDKRTSLRVYAFNSFMYAKLCKSGYDGVQRWTKKTDILANYDILLFPVNLPDHWTLAVADLRTQTLSFYDSLLNDKECKEGKEGKRVLKNLLDYLNNESLKRHGVELDVGQWQLGQSAARSTEKRTLQRNGSDCGIFVCKYAEAIVRGSPLYFDAEESLNARRQLLCELMLLATLHSLDCSAA